MNIIQHPLKFWDERPQCIDTIVFHCSAYELEEMIEVLQDSKLSAHYIIGTDGKIVQLVPEEKRAWHAGVSFWRGAENINHRSIGIELSSPTMGQNEYTKIQIQNLCRLCKDIMMRHPAIISQNIVAHSDIAPSRKPDPGRAFPWQWLAAKGIGLWYNIEDAAYMQNFSVESLLNIIGYNTTDLPAAKYAFCRHFAPQVIPFEANIRKVIDEVYPADFVLLPEIVQILRAVAYRYLNYQN